MAATARYRTPRGVPTPARGGRLRAVRRLFAPFVAAVAGVGAVVGAWWWLTHTDVFSIRTVAIEGTSTERAEEIKALLNLKMPDGSAGGGTGTSSLLFLDLADARSRVEGHPWVAKAFVKRELPDTLRVVVTEREPKLILALDRLYYLDAAGVPFKALQAGDSADLPVLTGLSRDEVLKAGASAHEAIAGALELAAALSSPEAKGALSIEDVSEISFDERRGYTALTVKGNEEIRFGSGDWQKKLARLKEVRAERKGEPMRTVDLTYASRVVVSR
ncbi:MAG TPA: FtsQ-type POTRA domain-containing protein [bacterium]|nr:FtsQ-type POTRA domain-containing protein [bacterium]